MGRADYAQAVEMTVAPTPAVRTQSQLRGRIAHPLGRTGSIAQSQALPDMGGSQVEFSARVRSR